jgi:hypothetical protein
MPRNDDALTRMLDAQVDRGVPSMRERFPKMRLEESEGSRRSGDTYIDIAEFVNQGDAMATLESLAPHVQNYA